MLVGIISAPGNRQGWDAVLNYPYSSQSPVPVSQVPIDITKRRDLQCQRIMRTHQIDITERGSTEKLKLK